MDAYKQEMTNHVGVGGLRCSCCNDFTGKDKRKLNRRARRTLKRQDKKTPRDADETPRE